MHKRSWGIIIGVVALTSVIVSVYLFTPSGVRVSLAQNPVIKFLQPTYRSFRKIVDLPFVLYTMRNTSLPIYEISISTEDLQRMNAALPTDTVKGRLLDENKLTVKADFSSGDYTDRIKVRFRGRGPNHWNAYKKSLHIEFPDDHPLNGITELKLFIPEDRNYLIEPLNMERAKRLGLFTPEPYFVRIRLNGEDMGVYTAMSHWSSAFADRAGFGESANFFGIQDFSLADLERRNFFDPAEISAWEDYTKTTEIDPSGLVSLNDFLRVVNEATDDDFRRALPVMVNMDALYDWLVINALASSAHQNATVNIVLLRDPSTGLLQPLPWNNDIFPPGTMSLAAHPLIGRTLAVPEFRAVFLERLASYVHDDSMLERDLKYYDDNAAVLMPELYSDIAKVPTNFNVRSSIADLRKLVISNYKALQKLEQDGNLETILQETYPVLGTLSHASLSPTLASALMPMTRFLALNSNFTKLDAKTISIGPGTVYLGQDTVLPSGVSLIIQPGTNLAVAPGKSLIVFGSLNAIGSVTSPITITGQHWGSIVAIADSSHAATIRNVDISGGSGFAKDGRAGTGMLAVYGGMRADITYSRFHDNFDDDALNVKRGSVEILYNSFLRTFGDAIDIDSGRGKISENTFGGFGYLASKGHGPNGDGIDMSLSVLDISRNVINGCGDKGMSVGEASNATITENIISGCAIGIAIKDLSFAGLHQNLLSQNKLGITLFQKKPLYGGATATLYEDVLWKNESSLSVDDQSSIIESVSVHDSSYGSSHESALNALTSFTKKYATSYLSPSL